MMRRSSGLLFICTALAGLSACAEPPEINYETRHLEIATDFEDPVCQGTLNYLEDHLDFIEDELDVDLPHDSKIRIYWLEDTLDEWCRETASGCYYPGTRVVFSEGRSITHEMVHALLNAEAHTSLFIEEGLAELYSGAGSRHRRTDGEVPPISELVWLTPEEYRAQALDYSLAANFTAWLRSRYGNVVNQRLAGVVTEGGGPEDLAYELERLNQAEISELEHSYGSHFRTNYAGLRDADVPLLDLDVGLDLALGCDEEETMGPLPDGEGGMYRVYRLPLAGTQILDLRLYGSDEVRVDLIDVGAERRRGRVLDYFMPRPSESLEHPRLRGTQELELELEPGTYLVYISTQSYERQEFKLAANLREPPPPWPTGKLPPAPGGPE